MISRSRIGLLCVITAAAVASLLAATSSAAAAGTIEGEVVDAVTEVGIKGVVVCAFNEEEEDCEPTDASGLYTLSGLPAGNYLVEFWGAPAGYVSQFFDGAARFEEADEVTIVGSNTVTGVDAELEAGGAIGGRVTDATTGAGIGGIFVCAGSSEYGECELTDSAGDYLVKGLPTASYKVQFLGEELGYETRFYNEQTSFSSANPVDVIAPGTTGGIDGRLSKPGSSIVVRPATIPALPAIPILRKIKPKPKAVRCRKGFKKAKRHGHKVCVKKHKKKKHRS